MSTAVEQQSPQVASIERPRTPWWALLGGLLVVLALAAGLLLGRGMGEGSAASTTR